MKNLLMLAASFFLCATTSAQNSSNVSKEAFRAAREVMKHVESTLLKENNDPRAVALITRARDASIKTNEYLTSLPGYKQAVLASVENKPALNDFKKKVRTEDEKYIALAKEARVAQKTKLDYLNSISPEYKKAWEDYTAYRRTKK